MQTTLRLPHNAASPVPTTTQPAIIAKVATMPLASTQEIARATGRSLTTTTQNLRLLAQDGHILQCTIGATLRAMPRWFLGPTSFQRFDIDNHFHNTRRGMGLLANRIYATERIYQLAHALDLLRPEHTFQWYSQRPYDAIAGSPDDWTALFWSGIWEDPTTIRRKIVSLGNEVGPIWPRLLAFAVPDHWQAQLLRQVLDDLHLTQHATVLVAADDTWDIPPPPATPRASAGWPDPPTVHPPPRPTAGHELIAFLDKQHYTGQTGPVIQRILHTLEQWPGAIQAHIRSLFTQQVASSTFAQALDHMETLQLTTRANGAYYPGPNAWTRAAHRDRVHHRRTASRMGRTDPNAGRSRLRNHDWAAIRIAAHFQQQGADIAPGWRAVDDAGPAGKLDPDAMVYLTHSPYGTGWHYLEYERRAKTSAAIAHKLRSYLMPQRSNHWPVIFVVANPDAERLYWEHGRDIKLITAVDNGSRPPTEWRCFGTPVQLASPPPS